MSISSFAVIMGVRMCILRMVNFYGSNIYNFYTKSTIIIKKNATKPNHFLHSSITKI